MEPEFDYGMYDKMTFSEKLNVIFNQNNIILLEKTFDFSEDVDLIWKHMNKFLTYYKKFPQHVLISVREQKTKAIQIYSDKLTSEICREAHSKLPVDIYVGYDVHGNSYSPKEKRISISLNGNAIYYLGDEGLKALPEAEKIYPAMGKEFSKESLKGSIAHELAHWVGDALHNDKLLKWVNYAEKQIDKKKSIDPIEWKYINHHEVDAQIHAMEQLKRKSGKKWDKMTFGMVLKMKPSFIQLIVDVSKAGEKSYQKWVKRFFSRLVRENLLGKNMRPISYQDVKKISHN